MRARLISEDDRLRFFHRQGDIAAGPTALATAAPVRHGACRKSGLILRRRWRTVGGMILVGLLAGAAYCRLATPLYTASAQVMLQESGSTTAGADRRAFFSTQQQLITSTSVLAMAISSPGVAEAESFRGQSDPLKAIKRMIRVEADRGGDLVTVSADLADARDATRLVAAVVDSFIRFESGLHGGYAKGSLATLANEKAAAQANWKQKWSALQQFAAAHGLAQGDEQIDSANTALHEIGIRLANAHVDTAAARVAYEEVLHDLSDDPATAARLAKLRADDATFADGDEHAIAKQIAALESQLSSYSGHFMANYPAVQTTQRKIDDLKVTRDAIIRYRWQAASRCEDSLRASFAAQQSLAAAAETNQKTYQQLQSDVADAEKQVGILDVRLKALNPSNESVKTIVTVTEPAAASDGPTSPRIGWVLFLSAIPGLVIGCLLAAWRDARALPQANAAGTARLAGMPILARLPAVQRRHLAINPADRKTDPASVMADACQRLFQKLDTATDGVGKSVLITSTQTREGKSTLTSLLAATLARAGRRVLVVDANLHTPVQGRLFGVTHDRGLAELLESEIELDFSDSVQVGRDGLVDVLLPGTTERAPQELLNSERFSHLLSEMAQRYDFVLVDSPAVSIGADAQIIAGSCDETILLASESNLRRKALNRTRQSLTMVGGHVLGVVLNEGMEAFAPLQKIVAVDVSRRVRPEVVTEASHISTAGDDRGVDVFQAARHVELNTDVAAEFTGNLAEELFGQLDGAERRTRLPREEIAVLIAAVALAAWSFKRGGAAAASTFGPHAMAIFLTRGLDVILWFAALTIVWTIAKGQSKSLERRRFADQALTLFTHASAMSTLIILFGSHAGGERTLEFVAIASCVASILTSLIAPARSSICFWASPLCVAIGGYALAVIDGAYLHHELFHGVLGALSRPLPAVYASMGPLGALIGMWVGRQFARWTPASMQMNSAGIEFLQGN